MDYSKASEYFAQYAKEILSVDSPSGFTKAVIEKAESIFHALGYETTRTRRGNVMVTVPGRKKDKRVALAAHLDTLGLIVRSVSDRGEIRFASVGSPVLPSLDGEYCRVYTRDGRCYTGTVLSLSPAKHVFPDVSTRARDQDNMHIRLDEPVYSREDVLKLGITAGCYVCYDPKFEITPSGYVKSRFLDDKASVACFMAVLRLMKEQGIAPEYETTFVLTVHEEVGSGGATIPADLDELLIVDMGCIGLDLTCTEQQVSICAKDSGGPYDYDMTNRLIALAEREHVNFALDVYPMYSSDASVAWKAGHDVRSALIGTGVQASHGMERTHMDGIMGTMRLMGAYLDI